MTLSEYMRVNGYSVHRITVLAGVAHKVVRRALENGETTSKKLLAWCERSGVTIDKTDKTKPPADRHWREKDKEDNSYLPVVLASIVKGAREIRVFDDAKAKIIVDHFEEQGVKYRIVPFNDECVHVKLVG